VAAEGVRHAWAIVAAALVVWVLMLWGATRIPPMQSPDEHSHVARAYLLCQGQWTLFTPLGQSSGGLVDRQLVELMDRHLRLVKDASARLSINDSVALGELHWSGEEIFSPIPGTGYYLPLIYSPQALGLCLGRALRLPMLESYQLARGAAVTTVVLLLAVAAWVYAPGPITLLVLCLPMSLFQALSPTVDGVSHALTLLVAALFVRLFQRDFPASAWLKTGWVVAMVVLAGSRPQLLPIFLLAGAAAWRRRDGLLAAAGALGLAAVLGWYVWAAGSIVDTRLARSEGLGAAAGHYAAHPQELLRVVRATLGDAELQLFYGRSFVGILGWLDTMLPLWAYPALAAALGGTALFSALRGGVGPAAVWLWAVALAAVPLVLLSLLVGWTPLPATRIEGVQGRYFIAPALLAAMALASPATVCSHAAWRRLAGVGAVVTATVGIAVALVAFAQTLAQRYH